MSRENLKIKNIVLALTQLGDVVHKVKVEGGAA